MMRWLAGLVLLATAGPSAAIIFTSTCENACGVEEVVAGASTVCAIVVTADPNEMLDVREAHYVVHHADGDEVVAATGTPAMVTAGNEAAFPATIAPDASDTERLFVLAASDVLLDGAIPLHPTFPDAVTIVPASTCAVTTTTVFATPTTTDTTTTTQQAILGFPRMKVCAHNNNPKKCR